MCFVTWSRKAARHGAGAALAEGARAVWDMVRRWERVVVRREEAALVREAILRGSTAGCQDQKVRELGF